MTDFEQLLMKRMDSQDEALKGINTKLDEVRTTTLPAMKTDIALITERDRFHNKVFSGVSSIVAVIAGVFLSHIKRGA